MIYIFVVGDKTTEMVYYYARKVIAKKCPEWIKSICSLLLREEQILLKKCSDDLGLIQQQLLILMTLNGVTPKQFLDILYTYCLEDTEVEDISGEFGEKDAAEILVSLSIFYNVLL